MRDNKWTGTVVEGDVPGADDEGLYLLTDAGDRLKLIGSNMAVQMTIEAAHAMGRHEFEPHLGKRVVVAGHDGGSIIWEALVVGEVADGER